MKNQAHQHDYPFLILNRQNPLWTLFRHQTNNRNHFSIGLPIYIVNDFLFKSQPRNSVRFEELPRINLVIFGQNSIQLTTTPCWHSVSATRTNDNIVSVSELNRTINGIESASHAVNLSSTVSYSVFIVIIVCNDTQCLELNTENNWICSKINVIHRGSSGFFSIWLSLFTMF